MAKSKVANSEGSSEMTKRKYGTLAEWKAAFLPELSKQDAYKGLRQDTEQLARTLANDTFERVRRHRGI
jgi:hypothetical protein